MKAREAQIASQIMLDMDAAIKENDRNKFMECLADTRVQNCIIGQKEWAEKYCQLCVRALKAFI